MAAEGHAAMEPRLNRRGHRDRPAPGYPSAEESSGGLDLSHGMDDEGPDRSVPQRHLRPGRATPGSDRRGGGVLQSGGQSSADGAPCAVSVMELSSQYRKPLR